MTTGTRPETAAASAGQTDMISPVSSTSSQPSSSSHSHGKLPAPPPKERQASGKGRSVGPSGGGGGGQRFKVLGRKGNKEKRKSLSGLGGDEDDEDWTMEGMNSNNRHGHDVLVSPPSPLRPDISNNAAPPPSAQEAATLFDSQLTEVPAEKKRGKGRGLVKKTSRLFSRDKDKDKEGLVTGGNLAVNKSERQSSYSSANSNDSAVSNSSTSSRPPSSARNGTAKAGHLRRLSQDSQFSWHAAQGSVRSGVSSIREMSGENKGNNNSNTLSASVPALNRNALPQPGPSTRAVGQDTIPSRMSSWITNFLPATTSSAETGSQPDSQASSSSPARKGPSAAASFLYAARQKAVDGMRHLLDSEAQPDKSPDTIWVMGVGHPGYRPSTPVESPLSLAGDLPGDYVGQPQQRRGSNSSGRASPPFKGDQGNLRPAVWPKRKETGQAASPPPKAFGNIFSTSTLSLALPNATSSPGKEGVAGAPVDSPSKGKRKEKEIIKWPEQFYDDFRSRVWCTYRSQYAPIVSLSDRLLVPSPEAYYSAFASPADATSTLPRPKPASTSLPNRPSTSAWAWTRSGEERGLTSDAGWGCMLRTGQSMLANALIHLHLGRDWRAPIAKPDSTTDLDELDDYATYVRLLSWFLDDPSPLCPFSVHRMALIGKELGKEVGEWFGPSTAAGALKTLTNSFSPCGLAVATATDSMVYKSDVYAASSLPSRDWFDEDAAAATPTSKRSSSERGRTWGDKAVLILIGLRLGLDGVNPIYYDSIKALFTLPQSVGIAGGRPSSSYYFVASQANSLFYLDPHITRPAVPLETPPAPTSKQRPRPRPPRRTEAAAEDTDELVVVESPTKRPSKLVRSQAVDDVIGLSSGRSSGEPSPTDQAWKSAAARHQSTPPGSPTRARKAPDSPTTPLAPSPDKKTDVFTATDSTNPTPTAPSRTRSRSKSLDEPDQDREHDTSLEWYANAYSDAQLRTFHCEKVKKIPLSGLDPSMLLGFLCRTEAEFEDFCERASRLPHKIFTVQDEPPVWDDQDDTGLESVSEPDLDGSDERHSGRAEEDEEEELLQDEFTTTTQNAIEIETDQNRLAAIKAPAIQRAEEEDEVVKHESEEIEAEEGTAKQPQPQPRPPKPRPLQSMGPIGTDTQSWIRPVTTGQEAPNGKSVL